MLIAIDLDQTIVDNGSKSDGYYPDLFKYAKDVIEQLRSEGHKIMIFSCNNQSWIEKVLEHHKLEVDYIWRGDKPNYDILIDDRAINFHGEWDLTDGKIRDMIKERNGTISSKPTPSV